MFFKKEESNIVRINSIEDLKKRKIKPSDLNKIFIDAQGQQYKLRYDPSTKKVKIVKIIKAVLDGTFIKEKYDQIARDKKVEEIFKYKFSEIGKKQIEEVYKAEEKLKERQEKPQQEKEVIKSVDEIVLNTIDDVDKVFQKIKERLEIAEKNIYASNVLDARFNYDDKIILDDISRTIKTSIIEEFKSAREKINDILKGYEDTKLRNKFYEGKILEVLEGKTPDARLKVLRQFEAIINFLDRIEDVIKGFDDIDYKLSMIPREKISLRPFIERQKFEDAKFTINTCKQDMEKIKKFFENKKKELLAGNLEVISLPSEN